MNKKLNLLILAHVFGLSAVQAQEPINLTRAQDAIIRYYQSGEYEKDVNRVIDGAILQFSCNKAAPENAYEKPTVIFDIDDTVLTNYADMKAIRFGYAPELFHAWTMRSDAPAIRPVKRLYDFLVSCGYHIVFISGRHDGKDGEYEATVKNLIEQGYTTFDKLVLRSKEEKNLSAQEYKFMQRKKLRSEGYTIVGSVGDQRSDLCCEDMGVTVKIPNPMYTIA